MIAEALLAYAIANAPLPAKKPWTREEVLIYLAEWDCDAPAPTRVPKPDLPE